MVVAFVLLVLLLLLVLLVVWCCGAAGCVVLLCYMLLLPILNLVHRIVVAAARAKTMQLFILFEYHISLFLLNITALRVSLPVASW